MTTLSLINMILILSIVVGGFSYFLRLAMKKENQKKENLNG